MQIKISESCIYVSNIENSRHFFGEVLGFPIKKEGKLGSNRSWAKFDLGVELLVMDGAKGKGRPEPVGSVIETVTCLETNDFDSFRQRLLENSVSIESEENDYLVFKDPDGNRFEVFQWSEK